MGTKKRIDSLRGKIVKPMIWVLLLQTIIFSSVIFFGGTIKDLENNEYEILNQKSLKHSIYIQEKMLEWSNIDADYISINNILRGIVTDSAIKNDALNTGNRALSSIKQPLIQLLNNTNTTGVFVILDQVYSDGNKKAGVYIRDLNKGVNNDNPNLVLEIGSLGVAHSLQMQLSETWREDFIFGDENIEYMDFYNKAVDTSKKEKNENYKGYEYWSKPFNLNKNDIESITYTVPLLDEYQIPYGVMGVEISIDYIQELFEVKFESEQDVMTLIGLKDKESNEVQAVLVGDDNMKFSNDIFDIKIGSSRNFPGIFEVSGIDDMEIFTNVTDINIYSEDEFYQKERWVVLNGSQKDELLASRNKLLEDVFWGVIISLILGIIVISIISVVVTKPITKMVKTVRQINPAKVIKIDEVNISELDELATSIENLSKNIAENASKLSKIINLVNMPIGAFEYVTNSNVVYCTESFFKVLSLPIDEDSELYMNMEKFRKIISDITKEKTPNEKNVFCIKRESGKVQYIRLRMIENNLKTLGVIVDVTEDIKKKQKIEYERDHDVLTGLYNRIAFRREVKNYIENGHSGQVAAFLMWDLDSLKYVNDTFGHEVGDKYIKIAADSINKFTNYGGVAGRIGGDEFNAFIGGYNSKDEIRQIIYKIKKDFEKIELALPNGEKKPMRASMGVAWYPSDSENYEDLSKFSDYAMYEIKKTTKGALKEFDISTYKDDGEMS